MGFLKKLFTTKTLGELLDIDSNKPPNTIYYFDDKEYNKISKRYYLDMERIEQQWSVMYNLNNFDGERAHEFELLCMKNIDDFFQMTKIGSNYSDYQSPINVPAFKRLAMLYEKQGKYNEAVNVCKDAIKCGAVNDGSKGGMQGRLARILKKGNIPITEEIDILLHQ